MTEHIVRPSGREATVGIVGKKTKQKRVLLITFGVVLVTLLGTLGVATWILFGSGMNTFGKVDFANRLAVPPLANSRVDADGRRIFELDVQRGTHNFASGHAAKTLGFNGSYLGPTLRAAVGEQVLVKVRNGMDEDTSVHWHGMHLPAAMDGSPHQLIRPGRTWSSTWKVDQPAATLWYHPHPHGTTAAHAYRGLAGMFILDDANTNGLNLPKTYGIDDFPILVQDKDFKDDGDGLGEGSSLRHGLGILGDDIVVNGTYAPYLDVTTELVRLRMLNVSNARSYNFGFDDNRQFSLIGTDGGLLERPAHMNRIQVAVGERAEIVVKVKPGERTVLRSYEPDLGGGMMRIVHGSGDQFDVLQLRAAQNLSAAMEIPPQLSTMEKLDPSSSVITREFELGDDAINDEKLDMSTINHASTIDTTEIWNVFNNGSEAHTFHVHNVQFQVLSINGHAPPPELSGLKDTISVHKGRNLQLIMRFTDYTDPNTPYMYHCHVFDHEDKGMMGQFVVVKPGEQPGTINHGLKTD
jgi:FtsP/CotA-like multicopper oxidase with cupredoxin domain